MTHFKKKLAGLFVFITMLSFVVSTTGFTSYTHKCQHHDSQKSLSPIKNTCCSVEVKVKTEDSCCAVSSCIVNDDHSTCCTDEMSYYRLSEWYTATDNHQQELVCNNSILLPFKIYSEDEQSTTIQDGFDHDPGPLLKVPKYRLHMQSKINPPLI